MVKPTADEIKKKINEQNEEVYGEGQPGTEYESEEVEDIDDVAKKTYGSDAVNEETGEAKFDISEQITGDERDRVSGEIREMTKEERNKYKKAA